jgi:hypothetical protein
MCVCVHYDANTYHIRQLTPPSTRLVSEELSSLLRRLYVMWATRAVPVYACLVCVNVILILVLGHTSIRIAGIAALRSMHALMDGQPNVIYQYEKE